MTDTYSGSEKQQLIALLEDGLCHFRKDSLFEECSVESCPQTWPGLGGDIQMSHASTISLAVC